MKLLGIVMLIAFFTVVFCAIANSHGVSQALVGFGVAMGVTVWCAFAVYLITYK